MWKPAYPQRGGGELRNGLVGEWLFHEGSGSTSTSPSSATLIGEATWTTASPLSGRETTDPLPSVGITLPAAATIPAIQLGSFTVGSTGSLFGVVHITETTTQYLAWGAPAGSSSNESFAVLVNADFSIRLLNDKAFDTSTAAGVASFGLHTFVIGVSGTRQTLHWDGVKVIDHTEGTGVSEALGLVQLGRRFTVSNQYALGSTFYTAAAWNRLLSDEEAAHLHARPYALFESPDLNPALLLPQGNLRPHRTVTP